MNEILCSIHNYTKFSGGSCSFYDIAQSALDCGLDVVFTTDKNVFPVGYTQFYYRNGKYVLFICGEELFDPVSNQPQNYLSLGIEREQFNKNPGNLQDEIRIMINPDDEIKQIRHIELINAQDLLSQGLFSGQKIIQKNIQFFDKLLQNDQRCTCLTGTCSAPDLGKFSYPQLLSTTCNHILSEETLTGELNHDKQLILKSIKAGHLYIAIDGLADAQGFLFSAEGNNQDSVVYSGDNIYLKNSITLKIHCPDVCTCRLIRNGSVIKEWQQCKQVPFTIYEPGYYRVECDKVIRKTQYSWIFSNPIYVVRG